jgi:tetratricopeptide (TPR) repeat protein
MGKESIKITSAIKKEFSTKINLAGEEYLIDSEDLGIKNPVLITRVYHKGAIIYSHQVNYRNILEDQDFETNFLEMVKKQQDLAGEAVKIRIVSQNKKYSDYIKEVEALLRKNNQKEALKLLTDALDHYPNNPFIWSYQGFLEASVNKKYSKGVNTCRHAFKILSEQMPFGEEFFFPILYLNLGKAYLAAKKKKDAYDSFKKGLEIDVSNKELLSELRKLGLRREPPISFLDRSNPLNKYIGKLMYKLREGAKRAK